MKSFTVKEISELLETNPETVRRWIRDGKLLADQSSKKEGNVVSAGAFGAFLESTPKYASKASENIARNEMMNPSVLTLSFIAGLSVGAVSAILAKMLLDKRNDKEAPAVSFENLLRYIKECISDCEKSIEQKKEDISRLTESLNNDQRELENYKAVLKKISSPDQ